MAVCPRVSGLSRLGRLVCLVAITALSGCFLLPEDPVTLTVNVEGQGRVFSFGLDFNCTSTCTIALQHAEAGGVFAVHAEPRSGWAFDSWQGRCLGVVETSCTVQYDAGTSGEEVGVTFVQTP